MINVCDICTFGRTRWSVVVFVVLLLRVLTAHAADDLTKHIEVSPNGRYLVTPSGEPFFWLADTGLSIFARLTREEADFYLRDRAQKGFTVIQAVAAGSPLDDFDVSNRYGALPFKEHDPFQPNPAYFAHVDCKRDTGYRNEAKQLQSPWDWRGLEPECRNAGLARLGVSGRRAEQ